MLGRQPDVSEKTGNILWPTDGANGWNPDILGLARDDD